MISAGSSEQDEKNRDFDFRDGSFAGLNFLVCRDIVDSGDQFYFVVLDNSLSPNAQTLSLFYLQAQTDIYI